MKNLFKVFLILISFQVFSSDPFIIDVRTTQEYESGYIENSLNIEWQNIETIPNAIKKNDKIYVYCRSGNRSGKAAVILEKIGFTNVINAGGIKEAAKKLDKKIVQYSE